MRIHETGPDGLDVGWLYGILRLRSEVFVVEQKAAYADLDGRDLEPETRHLWFAEDGRVLSYLRVLTDPGGVARIGRVCTAEQARGKGLSRELMQAALARIGDREAVLDAQSYLTKFYGSFGFVASGPEYVDEDGIPHVPMLRARSA